MDGRKLTVRVLSRLRDLWELSSGYICLDDHYSHPADLKLDVDDFAEGLGIKLNDVEETEDEQESEVVKKAMGENDVKRANIVKEIIDTEESYIRGLQELVDVTNLWHFY